MKIIDSLQDWRTVRARLSGTVGFVPTMGALHAGHMSLVARSCGQNDVTVVSIYVNPTQFDQSADLAAYPTPLEADLALLRARDVDYVLLPRYEDIYPDGFRFHVEETCFARELCGAHRANHFTGVLTVVMKLLNLVRPKRAYFGEKDYQQFMLVRDMAAAFFLDVEIVPCPIIREPDGLALSSRNVRLDAAARRIAPELHKTLRAVADDSVAVATLQARGFEVDYVKSTLGRRFGAVRIRSGDGDVRLIDNVPIGDVEVV
jgi:pantoate--beta-alanine ligase